MNEYCGGNKPKNITNAGGYIMSPNHPNDYPNFADCQWHIQVAYGSVIQLFFTNFTTESNYDTVFVYDGNNINNSNIGTFSGNAVPESITSSGRDIFIRFTSDSSSTRIGFSIQYQKSKIC